VKPLFLDCPGRYTRSSNVQRDDVAYACAVQGSAPRGYGWAWWACMAVISVGTLVLVLL